MSKQAIQTLSKILTVIRFNDWWNYKIPPLFGLASISAYLLELGPQTYFTNLGLCLIWIMGAAGFGHYLNDLFDIKVDAAAGKTNRASSHTIIQKVAILSGLGLLVFLPWMIQGAPWQQYLLVGTHLVLFVLYSAPFPRLKEKGLAGILTDALYGHLLPALVVILGMDKDSFNHFLDADYHFAIAALTLWSVLLGMRNIIGHQLDDIENDLEAGISTFVLNKEPNNIKKLLRILWGLELITFVLLFALLGFSGYMVLAGFLVFGLFRLVKYKFIWKKILANKKVKDLFNTFTNNFYEQYFPLICYVVLGTSNPWFLTMIPMHLLLFPEGSKAILDDFKSIWV